MGVADVDDIDPFDLEPGDHIDFVVANHAGDLRAMVCVEIGRQQRFHRIIPALLPASLQLEKSPLRDLLQRGLSEGGVHSANKLEQFHCLVQFRRDGGAAEDKIEVFVPFFLRGGDDKDQHKDADYDEKHQD